MATSDCRCDVEMCRFHARAMRSMHYCGLGYGTDSVSTRQMIILADNSFEMLFHLFALSRTIKMVFVVVTKDYKWACSLASDIQGMVCWCEADVDECAVNNGGCSPQANCTNTLGNLTCTCMEGYLGDGVNCTGRFFSQRNLPCLYLPLRLPAARRLELTWNHLLVSVSYTHLTLPTNREV